MSQADITRFRARCRQFRWLTWFMVGSVGLIVALMYVVAPVALWARGELDGARVLTGLLMGLPAACYLFAVWTIGAALGRLSEGRLIQPTLASTLRTVGIALGVGGVLSVFVVTNAARLVNAGQGGYLHFDVPGMALGMIGGALFLLGGVAEQAGRVQAELDEMI